MLEASGVIFYLAPYFENVGKRIVKSPKLYFADSGLLHHLVGAVDAETAARSPLAGALWESFCIAEIWKRHTTRDEASTLWYWRTRAGAEVDLVIHSAGRFDLVECKNVETPAGRDTAGIRAFKAAVGADRVRSARILCRTARAYPLGDGVEAIGIGDL